MRTIAALATLSAAVACAARTPARIPADLREPPGPEGLNARATIDRDAGEVVVWAGPFRVEPTMGGHAHGGEVAMSEGEAHDGTRRAGATGESGEEAHADHDAHADHEDSAGHPSSAQQAASHGAAAGQAHAGADAGPPGHAGHSRSPVIPIEWPADGYFRGFSLQLMDGQGNPLPRSLMHHLIAVNFDRRMFAYPVAERLFGIGTETSDLELPRTVGVPLSAGEKLGFYVMWDNSTGETLDEVYVRLAIPWTPAEEAGDIVQVLPLYVDVNNVIGYTNAFDLVPGHSERSWEFQPPVSGRFLMASGHLHDYGTVVRLEDAATDEVLLEIKPKLDDDGLIHGISREIMGVWYGGIRLEEGHTYRVVGVYDSPLADTIPMGAMAHIVGIFAPDDVSRWPEARPESEIWARDLSGLPKQTGEMMQARDAVRHDGGP